MRRRSSSWNSWSSASQPAQCPHRRSPNRESIPARALIASTTARCRALVVTCLAHMARAPAADGTGSGRVWRCCTTRATSTKPRPWCTPNAGRAHLPGQRPHMYRLRRANAEVRERRRQTTHPPAQKPEPIATAANQCWSWDITKLLGAGEVELLLPLRSYRHLEPLRSGLYAGPGRVGRSWPRPCWPTISKKRASARGN